MVLDYVNLNKNNEISVAKIKKVVADFYGVKVGLLSESNRHKEVAKARQIAMYLAKTQTSQSLPNIGKEFAKNHATVIYAVKSVQESLEKDAIFAKEIKGLEEKING